MHMLHPKHKRLKPDEVKKLLDKYNISVSQLPIIKLTDSALPEGCVKGDVIKMERKDEDDRIYEYYRVVV